MHKDVITVDEAIAMASKRPLAIAALVMKLQAEIDTWKGVVDGLQTQRESLLKYNSELSSIFSKESADLQEKVDKLTSERDQLLVENGEMKKNLERQERVIQNLQDDVVKYQTALAESYRKHLHDLNTAQAPGWVVTYSNGDERRFSTGVPLDLIVEYAEDASKFCGQITKIERR